jgi:hypothetical protein
MDEYQQAIKHQDKAKIYELMRQGVPVQTKLLPAIADVLEGKKPKGRPKKPPYDFENLENCPIFLFDLLKLAEYCDRYAELTGKYPLYEEKLQGKAIKQIAIERNKSASHIKSILHGHRAAT